MKFTDTGTTLIVMISDGYLDIEGRAVITTIDDSKKGSYTFKSIGYTDANGTIRDNGALFFHTNSTGKLAIINNLIVIFKDKIDKAGGMTVGWQWNR
jgi:hypothetical protein